MSLSQDFPDLSEADLQRLDAAVSAYQKQSFRGFTSQLFTAPSEEEWRGMDKAIAAREASVTSSQRSVDTTWDFTNLRYRVTANNEYVVLPSTPTPVHPEALR